MLILIRNLWNVQKGYSMNKNITQKSSDFSKTEHVHVVHPRDLNGGGRLFGGALLNLID